MASPSCPDRQAWQSFLLGNSPEEESQHLEHHLDSCPACQQLIPEVSATDPLVEVFRSQQSYPRLKNPQIEELRQELRSIQVSIPPPSLDATSPLAASHQATSYPSAVPVAGPSSNDPAAWLAPSQGPGELGRLGQYRVLRLMGQGGMGVVFQAEDSLLKRAVALKVMKPELAREEPHRQRFLREARAMAQLSHDYIVAVHQVGEERGMPFLAMPFLKGQTLEDRLRFEPCLPLSEVLRIGREVALGLAAAHAHNVIHRDIKPGNLWLEEGTGRVKILDFGLAWMEAPEGEQTMPGAVMGTPGYMAPEQAEGETDHRADLFSLGCVIYRMATGEAPFKGANPMQKLHSMLTTTPTPPQLLRQEIPGPLSQLILRLLARKPADRPTSAPVVAKVLETFQGQVTTTPAPQAAAYPMAIPVNVQDRPPALPPALPPVATSPAPSAIPLTQPRPIWRRPPMLVAAFIVLLLTGSLGWLGLGPAPVNPPPPPSDSVVHAKGRWIRALPASLPVPSTQPQVKNAWALHPAQLPKVKTWTITGVPYRGSMGGLVIQGDRLGIGVERAGFYPWRWWDFDRVSEVPVPLSGAYEAMSPNGKTMVEFSKGSVGLVDTATPGRRRVTLIIPSVYGVYADFSPDGETLALVHRDTGLLSFWNVEHGKEINEVAGIACDSTVSWAPDGKCVACMSLLEGKDTLCLIEPSQPAPKSLWKLDVDLGTPRVHWSPDGKLVALASAGQPHVLVDLDSEKTLTLDVGEALYLGPYAFAWSPDSKHVAVATKDYCVLVWSLVDQKIVHRFKGHSSVVSGLVFLPDNHTLVSAGYTDQTVRFWSLDSGQPRGTVVPMDSFLAAFSVDGHYCLPPGKENLLTYIVEDEKGYRRDKPPALFATDHNWTNDPKKVRLDGREPSPPPAPEMQ